MRTLYLECKMGVAGDMLTASLLELFDNKEEIVDMLNGIGIERVKYEPIKINKSGIVGSYMKVSIDGKEEMDVLHHNHHEHHHEHDHEHMYEHTHHHIHRSLQDITDIINSLNLDPKVKNDAIEVYKLIAKAESISHDTDISEIHFHEVGTIDAVADVVAVSFLINKLNPDRIVSSSLNLGSGFVECAHGILPVPAPATLYLIKDIPSYSSDIESELTTPTGAALIKYFADDFSNMPLMKISKIGYGMGKKDFDRLNAVRAIIGEKEDKSEDIYDLSFNVDDMTGEEIGFMSKKLFEIGALDVFTTSIGMKKSRPGIMVNVLTKKDNKDAIVRAIFKYTTTIGIRENSMNRYFLKRDIEEINTEFGKIRLKKSSGFGMKRQKYEYEDLARIAEENNLSIMEIKERL
ncbi:MAG: nickel pincer cofactor biosynthesis protein LarC [Tissierellia bacterium]|nr:nickel pincer cofactor biosynthesis protein LarC [Tissierellia bacterium]